MSGVSGLTFRRLAYYEKSQKSLAPENSSVNSAALREIKKVPISTTSSRPMQVSFQFDRDVDATKFKTSLEMCGIDNVSDEDLSSEFEKYVIDSIVSNQCLDVEDLKLRYGFKSEKEVQRFLLQPSVTQKLQASLTSPKQRLSPKLVKALQDLYQQATAEAGKSEIHDIQVLSTLFKIFEFIKSLSPEDVKVIEYYLENYDQRGHLYHYLGASSFSQFHKDLNMMSTELFEKKYANCFNGMLDSFVARILNIENLCLFMDYIKQNGNFS